MKKTKPILKWLMILSSAVFMIRAVMILYYNFADEKLTLQATDFFTPLPDSSKVAVEKITALLEFSKIDSENSIFKNSMVCKADITLAEKKQVITEWEKLINENHNYLESIDKLLALEVIAISTNSLADNISQINKLRTVMKFAQKQYCYLKLVGRTGEAIDGLEKLAIVLLKSISTYNTTLTTLIFLGIGETAYKEFISLSEDKKKIDFLRSMVDKITSEDVYLRAAKADAIMIMNEAESISANPGSSYYENIFSSVLPLNYGRNQMAKSIIDRDFSAWEKTPEVSYLNKPKFIMDTFLVMALSRMKDSRDRIKLKIESLIVGKK